MWNESYRPQKFEQVYGNGDLVKNLEALIKRAKAKRSPLPHLLLSGPPGCGKTTLAHIVAKELHADTKEMNMSLYRTIETVRQEVSYFTQNLALNASRKVLILDEVHGLWSDAQQALQRIMELRGHSTTFILCCNDEDKVIDTIKSRCATIRFHRLRDDEVVQALKEVLHKEKVTFNITTLKKLAKICNGDLRKAINTAETYAPTLNGYGSRPLWAY